MTIPQLITVQIIVVLAYYLGRFDGKYEARLDAWMKRHNI